ncbi:helix-turn-helix transcriptional regulator [Streptococcus sp. 121]|nr:helix-turn-helix transcriptional regulator [Streptococcus sp. 121]
MSLKEAAGDIISPQLLSQFELGKKNVSLSNFDQLLASVGISLLEFARVLELENRKTSIYENMYEKSGGGDFQGIISTKFSIEN